MALSDKQRAALTAEAQRRGINPDNLIREAEALGAGSDKGATSSDATAKSDAPLYMYLLPFATVNEVRTRWMGLDSVGWGNENAAKWAAQMTQTKPEDPSA